MDIFAKLDSSGEQSGDAFIFSGKATSFKSYAKWLDVAHAQNKRSKSIKILSDKFNNANTTLLLGKKECKTLVEALKKTVEIKSPKAPAALKREYQLLGSVLWIF